MRDELETMGDRVLECPNCRGFGFERWSCLVCNLPALEPLPDHRWDRGEDGWQWEPEDGVLRAA